MLPMFSWFTYVQLLVIIFNQCKQSAFEKVDYEYVKLPIAHNTWEAHVLMVCCTFEKATDNPYCNVDNHTWRLYKTLKNVTRWIRTYLHS